MKYLLQVFDAMTGFRFSALDALAVWFAGLALLPRFGLIVTILAGIGLLAILTEAEERAASWLNVRAEQS